MSDISNEDFSITHNFLIFMGHYLSGAFVLWKVEFLTNNVLTSNA